MDPNTTLAIIALAAAAILIDIALPQRGTRTWDNKRAATQRDVADVMRGRNPAQSGPRALPLVALLIVVFGTVFIFGP